MTSLVVCLGFASILAPGFALQCLLGGRRHSVLVSAAAGVAVLVVTQAIARWVGGGWVMWGMQVLLVTAGCLIASGYLVFRKEREFFCSKFQISRISVGATSIVLLWSAYWILVGGYSEVPSDFWNHLERIRLEADWVLRGELRPYGPLSMHWANRDYIHALHALASMPASMSILEAAEVTGYIATLLFLLATYGFALAVFRGSGLPEKRVVVIAILAVLFLVVSKGISVFSFIRYYALAPVMLAFVMYYGFLSIALGLLRGGQPVLRSAVLLVILGLGMLLAHAQEFFLAVVMTTAMVLVAWVVRRLPGALPAGRTVGAISLMMLASIAVTGIVLVRMLEPGPVGSDKFLYLGDYVPFFQDVFILRPGYQFFQVMGGFGLIVLVLSLGSIRRLVGQPFLLAGTILPLLTVFNPVFVYLFLHVAKYETLWRILFAVPVSFLAALLFVEFLARFRSYHRPRQVIGIVVIVAGVLTLLPVQVGDYRNLASRWGSLVDVRAEGIEWIGDAVDYLNTLEPGVVYSDPVTSYVIRGATVHSARGWKFYPARSGYDFSDMAASGELSDFIAVYSGLYLVNRRDVANTRNGADSGHWYADVLTTSKWYPDGLETQLMDSGAKLLFEVRGLSIYHLLSNHTTAIGNG